MKSNNNLSNHFKTKTIMKPKIFAVILLLTAFVTSSFAKSGSPAVKREIAIMAPFKKIIVGEYINVVLVQDPYRLTITVSGDEKNVQYVHTNIYNNRLTISSKKNLTGKKITVYIPVGDLSEVHLSTGASVSGEGILKFPDLTVIMSDDTHTSLDVLGDVKISSNENCDFVYEKNEKYKVISSSF